MSDRNAAMGMLLAAGRLQRVLDDAGFLLPKGPRGLVKRAIYETEKEARRLQARAADEEGL